MNFNDFYWHDAIIKNIQIDRNSPGVMDAIIFDIEWPGNKGKAIFIFEEVYWASMNMNFGIVANETILSAFELEESDQDLKSLYAKWKGVINHVKLKSYKFSLNSTGSEIKIIAKRFREDKL
jgi:hypothetical protein